MYFFSTNKTLIVILVIPENMSKLAYFKQKLKVAFAENMLLSNKVAVHQNRPERYMFDPSQLHNKSRYPQFLIPNSTL